MDLYKYVAQNGIRFPSIRGQLTAEQLYDLPLKSGSNFDLDTVARNINNELKGMSEESFVEDSTVHPKKKGLQVALEIVKDVIATKQELNRVELARRQKTVQVQKVRDAIAAKKDEKITSASLDELETMLKNLQES